LYHADIQSLHLCNNNNSWKIKLIINHNVSD
jgi:hypothetical protein